MNLINRKMRLFCVSNIMLSFICTNLLGTTYCTTSLEVGQPNDQVLASDEDTDPLSQKGEGVIKTALEVIDVPDIQELMAKVNDTKEEEVIEAPKVTKTVTTKKTTRKKVTNVVTKKEVKEATSYAPARYSEVTGNVVVEYAKRYLGLRYRSNSLSLQTGTDCSGFTKLIYKEFGITLSRIASGQAKQGTYVKKGDLQKGDLVFYSNGSGRITHVAMYIGGGQVIHESNHRDGVKISSVNMMQYITARRVINTTAKKIAEQKIEEAKKVENTTVSTQEEISNVNNTNIVENTTNNANTTGTTNENTTSSTTVVQDNSVNTNVSTDIKVENPTTNETVVPESTKEEVSVKTETETPVQNNMDSTKTEQSVEVLESTPTTTETKEN